MEAIGKLIGVPSSFFTRPGGGKLPPEEANITYQCLVREFDAAHKFERGCMSMGYEMQEMGESGTGSLEPGVASGEVVWMRYPSPFLDKNLCLMSIWK